MLPFEFFQRGLLLIFFENLKFLFFVDSIFGIGKILKMVLRDIFGFGPKCYLNLLVWVGANRAIAYNFPFCNDVTKKGL